MKTLLLTALTLATLAAPAAAQEDKAKKQPDPNRVICRTEEVTGSRLQGERVCLTSQQWAQRLRDQRESVEHAQTAPHF